MQQKQDEFLEKLFRAHFHELELYACAILRSQADAQIAVQDAFHAACERIDDVMASQNPVGWMKKAVRNVAKNMIKQKHRDMKMLLSLSDAGEVPDRPDNTDFIFLEFCRSKLSVQEYDLVYSIMIEGRSYQEKAQELNISLWACYKRAENARKKLKKALEKEK